MIVLSELVFCRAILFVNVTVTKQMFWCQFFTVSMYQMKNFEIQLIESCNRLIGVSQLFRKNHITSTESDL